MIEEAQEEEYKSIISLNISVTFTPVENQSNKASMNSLGLPIVSMSLALSWPPTKQGQSS